MTPHYYLRHVVQPCWAILGLVAAAVSAGGCTGDVLLQAPDDTIQPCPSPVSLNPGSAEAAPRSLLRFTAMGGTGNYDFGLLTDETGGEVHPTTGVYLAGEVSGVDTIRVRDRDCEGEARTEVTVHGAIEILPSGLLISPLEAIQFQARGGSDEYTFQITRAGSGGSVSPSGAYTAGPDFGQDVVQVRDTRTDSVAESIISVVADPSIAVSVPRVFIPVGSTYDVDVEGAPGVEVETTSDTLSIDGDRLIALSPGEATVTATDPFTGRTTSLRVTTVAASAHDGERREEFSEYATFSRATDLNGDGRPEVLYANPFSSAGGYRAGSVFMLTSEGSTLSAEPLQVLNGPQRDMRFGDAIDLIDLDGDGRLELLVGASAADITRRNNGAVYFYRINAAGQIEQPHYAHIFGTGGSDDFGRHFTTCDFNGDGALDLAVGAPNDENGERVPVSGNQGAVHLFLGRGDGTFSSTPAQSLYGEAPIESDAEEPEWGGVTNARFGAYLAAGDFDGDDVCDLASFGYSPNGMSNDGYVALHRGRVAVEGDRGGLEEHAGLRVSGLIDGNRNGQLGRYLAFAEFDGDGHDDLVIAHPYSDVMGETDAGAVYIIRGHRLNALPTREDQFPAELADRTFSDSIAYSNMGMGLAADDVNQDGHMDLVIASPRSRAELTESGRPGVVRVYLGRDDGLPWSDPSREIEGRENDARYGHGLRVVGQLVGSRSSDIMAVAAYSNEFGWRVPAASVAQIDDDVTGDSVMVPGSAAGSMLGLSVAIPGDLNGDGFDDMVATVPNEARVEWAQRRGGAHLFLGTATGFESSPAMAFVDFPQHGGTFGQAISAAGDVNGDGISDFAVLAPYTQTPSNITDTEIYVVADTCRAGAGRSLVTVFLGSASGLPSSRPAFMFVGPPIDGGAVQHIAGAIDVDGDDLDDILLSSDSWRFTAPAPMGSMEPDSRHYGGFALFRGNFPDDRGRIVVFCEPAYVEMGPTEDTNFGSAIVGVGDLNGDGCDEFAVGDTGFDFDEDTGNSGQVILYSGFDGVTCTATTPTSIRFNNRRRSAGAGNHLASGVDIDGDSLPDLLVGARQFRDSAGERGRTYLVRSGYLQAQLLAGEDGDLTDPSDTSNLILTGRRAGERFGYAVALLPNLGVVDTPGLAIAAPFGSYSGRTRTGSVLLYSFGEGGIATDPVALIAGDATSVGSMLGHHIHAGTTPGTPTLAVGAPWSSAAAADLGAAYGIQLTP